jgi:hypothetical protein
MEAPASKRSRFVAQSSGRAVRITPYVLSVLELLQRFRYLPSTYIHALIGGGETYYKDVLTRLFHERYIGRPASSWAAVNARYRPAVYELLEKGEQALKEHGRWRRRLKTGNSFPHELMVCLIQASFELGSREHGLQLIKAQDILDHPKCPLHTRHAKHPWGIPVSFNYNNGCETRYVEQYVETDGEFFGLAHVHAAGRTTIIFPGFEADRRTEPLEPDAYERSSIKKKFLAFREIAGGGLYQSRFGLPNAIVPFITINETHMRNMMRLVERITDGRGTKLFLFKYLSSFTTFEQFPVPDGHMVYAPWLRVGHPPYDILRELGCNK